MKQTFSLKHSDQKRQIQIMKFDTSAEYDTLGDHKIATNDGLKLACYSISNMPSVLKCVSFCSSF